MPAKSSTLNKIEDLSESVASYVAEKLKLNSNSALNEAVLAELKKISSLMEKTRTIPNSSGSKGEAATTFTDKQVETPVSEPKSELQKIEKPKEVLIAGFSEQGFKNFKDKLPEILAESYKKIEKDSRNRPAKDGKDGKDGDGGGLIGGLLSGLKIIAGGAGLLIAGLAALVTGIMTDGPFKGLLKILGKGGLFGGIKLIEVGAKGFMKSLKMLLKAPSTLLRFVGKSIKSALGAITKIGQDLLKSMTGGVGKIVEKIGIKSLGKFIPTFLKGFAAGLKKVPIIGSLISLGFAISRFKNGDIIGGGIEVLSGIASLFPGIGTGISIALDLLNAFLDMKTGGSNPETSKTKGSIITEWVKGLGGLIYKGIKKLPIIGPAIKAIGHIKDRQYLKALKQIAYINPALEALGGFLGDKEADSIVGNLSGKLGDWTKGLGDWIYDKVQKLPILGPAVKAINHLIDGEYLKALKQFAYINPAFEALGGFFGDQEASSVAGDVGNVIGDWTQKLGDWIYEKIKDLPIIGNIIEGIQLLVSDPLKAFKTMAKSVPILGSLVSFFEAKEESQGSEGTFEMPKNPFESLKEMILEKARTWWKNTWEWVRFLAKKVLPDSIINALENGAPNKEEIKINNPEPQENPVTDTFKEKYEAAKDKVKGAASWLGKKLGIVKEDKPNPTPEIVPQSVKEAVVANTEPSNIKASTNKEKAQQRIEELLRKAAEKNISDEEKAEAISLAPEAYPSKKPAYAKSFVRNQFQHPEVFAKSNNNITPQSTETKSNNNITPQSTETPFESKSFDNILTDDEVEAQQNDPGFKARNEMFGTSSFQATGFDSADNNQSLISTKSEPPLSFSKAESLLESISYYAGSTDNGIRGLINGFNNLAKVLEKTTGEKMPTIINNGGSQQKQGLTSSQYAAAGNQNIFNFRVDTVEGSRFKAV